MRQRYYGLLQEIRVLLPGVQVLVAFLLTAPFANHFDELDARGRGIFAVALLSGVASVITLITPMPRCIGARTARAERLHWAIRAERTGVGFLAVSMSAALLVVARLVFGEPAAVLFAGVSTVMTVLAWIVLPRTVESAPSIAGRAGLCIGDGAGRGWRVRANAGGTDVVSSRGTEPHGLARAFGQDPQALLNRSTIWRPRPWFAGLQHGAGSLARSRCRRRTPRSRSRGRRP